MERQRPTITAAPHEPPTPTAWVGVWHPHRDLLFLRLPALDNHNSAFGVHFGTAITACQILAHNKAGYLSSSRNPDGPGHPQNMDSIIHPGKYYYHLHSQDSEEPYPICLDFSSWVFPHDEFPQTWVEASSPVPSRGDGSWPTNPSAISERIKGRDAKCLISGWTDSLTTAHIVPDAEESWLCKNDMHFYLRDSQILGSNSHNLFTMRYDLYLGQFDQARFVIVPKSGQLLVHFLHHSYDSAQLYHNVRFDHENKVAGQALYARFAWALMKHSKPYLKHFEELQAPGTGGGGDGSTKGEHEGGSGDGSRGGCGDGNGGGNGGGHGGGHGDSTGGKSGGSSELCCSGRTKSALKGTKCKHGGKNNDDSGTAVCPGQDWEGQPLLEGEAEELEEDLETAAHTLTFFVDPDKVANPYYYENIQWYPGSTIVERRKQAYLETHPQIRAHSDQVLPDDYDTDEDMM